MLMIDGDDVHNNAYDNAGDDNDNVNADGNKSK
jgi:hypothetical protein